MFASVSSRSAAAYHQASIEASVDNADPHQLVNLLFDGLKRALGSAKLCMVAGDVPGKCKHISSAIRILEEGLLGGLNMEQGGPLAANLRDVYEYCVFRLVQANARNDQDAIDEVGRVIAPVADGWKQINGKGPAYLKPV